MVRRKKESKEKALEDMTYYQQFEWHKMKFVERYGEVVNKITLHSLGFEELKNGHPDRVKRFEGILTFEGVEVVLREDVPKDHLGLEWSNGYDLAVYSNHFRRKK